ncbi:immunoglobulin-like domain-containing protein [Algibacter sp. TI.3.09]|uniref:immunoglobulin-like domain-containing protein n=1 Tax=Algibacter sp. TI.3.09 TaxID=3121298 RepID=UPI00311F5DF8
MKNKNKITRIVSILCLSIVLASCSEARLIESEITIFPSFEIDEVYSTIQTGSSFTDSGVKALAGETELDFTTSGTVDTSTPGVYKLSYAATNSDGFDGTAFKYVTVVDDPAIIAANDLSGTYFAGNDPSRVMTVVKIADGRYEADDILPNNSIKVFMIQISETELIIPRQSSGFGDIVADPTDESGSSGTISATGDIALETFIGCCGIFSRNFVKQ